MIHHYFKAGFLFSVLFIFGISLQAQIITPFSSIYQTSQKGGIVFLSNSAIGCSSDPSTATGTCGLAAQETPLLGTTRNDDFLSTYIDIDGDVSTFMSSSDRLDLPSCSHITKAFLFWGASGTATGSFNQIKLKLNTGVYQTVAATNTLANTTGFVSYHCYADVTSLLSSAGSTDRVTVADIHSSAVGQVNTFGSWNLVVVYNNETMNMRQLNVFNGLAYLSLLTPSVNIPLSGFLTPTTGAVSFEVGAYSHDGDRGVTMDDISFNGNLLFLPLTDLENPTGDVMNSTVSNNGLQNAFRNPLLSNTMGSDADIYAPINLLNVYLANAANTATVRLTTTSDDYLTQALTTAIDSYDPDLQATLIATDVNGSTLNPGDVMQYRIRGLNVGNDNSTNTFITDTLDPNVIYIPNSTSITFGPNSGAKTDAIGDDEVDYNATTRVLKIRIGNGATSSVGGTVVASNTGADSTIVTYSVSISQSCLKLSCNSNSISSRAYISGTGSQFPAQTFTSMSTPGTSDISNCSVMGATTSTININSCTSATASSSSPACLAGNLYLYATVDPEATYSWTGPSSFVSALNNPTLSPVTNSLAGVYNVTLSIPNTTCTATASTAVTVTVCTPIAINDFTTTVVNTTVSANAAANDVYAVPGGTFSILNQPANGSLAIDPSTGQYTFTPALSFTGVTTATYQVCNSLPPICVTASITITVYPNIIANPDVINVSPSVTATGSLMANDTGTATGVTYSISFTPLSTTTGTLTVNPANGQYTFVPNPSYTGTTQTTYTLCDITVNPYQCSSATITINVLPNPAPVNDNITTVINTSVTGNASTNDVGSAGGTYTIVNQPVNGTISIDPSTGSFTFVPASNFIGVTSATYNLCNGAPVTCSPAVITITVYADLVANPDLINTTPGAAATGSLLANDNGITAGANYSVSFTQFPALTGILTVNASTGQYTFTPNGLFTGTAQTTYTVCNTSVNPQQCSSTTITIDVSNLPAAVNDGTTTVINVPVSGDASTNDSGTLGGTYTFGIMSSTTGTINGNALTGQYLFTPAGNFTGTTSVTYTLCNLSSPPCSTATITFTVYPLLIANPDAIVAAASYSTNGNLLTNDTGITPGATYSVSYSPVTALTGTLIVDAAGNYTFTPDPSFTGTAQTSYTVCNTSVNPQQCSSASITIGLQNAPIAVNDSASTLMGHPVTGDVSINDSNLINDTFTFDGPSPVTGTLTGNPSTGHYTFTPFSGFSGVTYASYTLCTSSAPCATALITFTVYPDLMAKPDLIITSINTPVSGDLMSNDAGMLQGGNYSLTVSPILNSIGNLSINSTTGHYTFTPASGYTGTSTATYTLTQYNGPTASQSSTTSITIIVKEGALPIGIAKSVASAVYNTNGTFYLTYKVVVKNYSAQTLTNVSVSDDLSHTFPSPTTYTVKNTPSVINPTGSQLTLNSSYSGNSDVLLTSAVNSSLAPGRTDTILFTVEIDPHGAQLTYNNSAYGSTSINNMTVKDTSANGVDPDPDHDGDPGNNSNATPFNLNLVKIGIAKYAERSNSDGNGCYNVTFKFTVKNYGTSPIYNIQVFDDLNNTFGASNYTVTAMPASTNGFLIPNGGYNGSANNNLTTYSSQLTAGASDTLLLHVKYCSGGTLSFSNTATAYGNSVPGGGFIGYDISTTGLDPDPNHNNNPSDSTESAVTVFVPAEDFLIPQGFSPNSDGINDYFEIKGIAAYPDLEVSILNRWGNLVYNKKQYDNTWNGKSTVGLEFGGNDLPEGTYFYIIDLGNSQKPLKGYVYLNRSVR